MVKNSDPGWQAIYLMMCRVTPSTFEAMPGRVAIKQFCWLATFSWRKFGLEFHKAVLIAFLLTVVSGNPAAAEETILVHLFEAHEPVKQIRILPPFQVVGRDESIVVNHSVQVEDREGRLFIKDVQSGRPAMLSNGRSLRVRGPGSHTIALIVQSLRARRYHGDISITAGRDGNLVVINGVPLRQYINDVVASELPPGTPPEMLKAQAILAQTLLCRRNRQRDIGDSTEQQVYLGAGAERKEISSAVSSVWGKILCYGGTPIEPYYHSTCAGGTSRGAEYFGLKADSLPYLRNIACNYCKRSPFWKPTRMEIPEELFAPVFGSDLPIILKRDSAGRALLVRLADGRVLSGYDFWIKLGRSFGWDKAPGTRYSLTKGKKDSLQIESTGAGHGVGLCQWGATELARLGKSYKEILSYYFPTCEVQ